MNNIINFKQDVNSPEQFNLLTKRKQEVLLQWINEILMPYKMKSFNDVHSSHLLKGIFTKQTGMYITNGEMKGALLQAGLEVKDKDHINWLIKVSKKRIENLLEKG